MIWGRQCKLVPRLSGYNCLPPRHNRDPTAFSPRSSFFPHVRQDSSCLHSLFACSFFITCLNSLQRYLKISTVRVTNFFIVGGSDPLDMAHHAVLIRFPAKLCSNFSLFDCDSLSFVAILLSFVRPDQCDSGRARTIGPLLKSYTKPEGAE